MLKDYIIKIRRHIHMYPEIGYNTHNTAKFINEELIRLGYEVNFFLNNAGIIAKLKLGKEKTIAFRSDIDALDLIEQTNYSFKSTNKYMHACGHDAHAAMLLGAAKLLIENKNILNVNITLIFQPAEEGPLPGGAIHAINTNLLNDVSMFFAFHVSNKYETNTIAIKSGEACAAPDLWNAKIIGQGCHASAPSLGNNPIIPASIIILKLEELYKNYNDQYKVISTACVKAGTSSNIIPDNITLEGTARSFSNAERDNMNKDMENIFSKISKEYNVKYEFNYEYAYDPVFNDEICVNIASNAVNECGLKLLMLEKKEMVGEDFSFYRRIAPICLMWLGVKHKTASFIDLHSPLFNLDEEALINGSNVFFQIAKDLK